MPQHSPFLLDTNILVELVRNKELGQRIEKAYNLTQSLGSALISIVTIGEVHSLARQWAWSEKKIRIIQALLDEVVTIDISNAEIVSAYGEIDHQNVKNGLNLGDNDVWIAATCKVAGAILLTMDKDFDRLQGQHFRHIWINPKNPDSMA